jgi:hypothetical protein
MNAIVLKVIGYSLHPFSIPRTNDGSISFCSSRRHSTQEGVVATYVKYTAGRRRARAIDTTITLLAGNGEGDSSSSSETQDGGEGDKGEAYVAVQGLLTMLLIIAPCKPDPHSGFRVGGLYALKAWSTSWVSGRCFMFFRGSNPRPETLDPTPLCISRVPKP